MANDFPISGFGIDSEFAKVNDAIAPNFNEMIAQTQQVGENWWDTAQKLLTAVTLTAQQSQLMQLNIERAKKGLPPVDIAAFTGIGVNVGLSESTKNLLIYGGIALVAVIFLTRSK